MCKSALLCCFGFVVLGAAAAQGGDLTEDLLAKIVQDIPAKIHLSPFSHNWTDRFLWVFKMEGSMRCSRGTAWSLKGLEPIGKAGVRDSSLFAFLKFSGLQFDYEDCLLQMESITGQEHEYGMLGDHRLNLEAVAEPLQQHSGCKITIKKFAFEFLDSVMVNESASMKYLKSFSQFENVREKIRSTVETNVGAELSMFVGKSYTVDAPCT